METDEPLPFGERLRRLREAAGWTQEQLAEKAGLSVQGVASLESGRTRRPYPNTFRALGEALRLTPEEQSALLAAVPQRPRAASTPAQPTRDLRVPLSRDPLVGREAELAGVVRMLTNGTRLLTLTGPGGVGKTSLALHLAAQVRERFPDGVTFVPLAAVESPDLVLPTVLRSLNLPGAAMSQALETLVSTLQDRSVLLILDNFEQVLAAARDLLALLAACDDVSILVTSRAPLRLSQEQEFPLQPLAIPELKHIPRVEEIASNPSVELFVRRARMVAPDFALGRENTAAIAAICRRLDGLPLAIELAAARIRALGPTELLSRLDSALPLLSGGARDLPERQQTMERAIRWSYQLLNEDERRLFSRLSVFRGGWSLDAADAVGVRPDSTGPIVVDTLFSLAEQSLVASRTLENGSSRYRLLVPIREFAAAQLEQDGATDDARGAHASYFLSLAGRASRGSTGPEQIRWMAELDLERDNLRAAMEWMLSAGDATSAADLAWNLWVFLWIRGYHAEGAAWMQRVLDLTSGSATIARARALGVLGAMALGQGNLDRARSASEQGHALFHALGEQESAARCAMTLGLILTGLGELDAAQASLQGAATTFRARDQHYWAALTTSALGMLPFRQGNMVEAETLLREGHALARKAGDRFSRYIALYNESRLEQARGSHQRAAALFLEGLAFSRDVGDRANEAHCLEGLAHAALAKSDLSRTIKLLACATTLFDEVGSRVYTYRPGLATGEQIRTEARAMVDEETWEECWAEGSRLSLDDAILLATPLASDHQEEIPKPNGLPHAVPDAAMSVLTSDYGLTPREIEILRLLVAHHSYREIADTLFISPRTVGTHITSINSKLGVTSRREVAAIAQQIGFD